MILRDRDYLRTGKTTRPSRRAVRGKLSRLPVDAGKCLHAPDPQLSAAVLKYRGRVIAVQAVGIEFFVPVGFKR